MKKSWKTFQVISNRSPCDKIALSMRPKKSLSQNFLIDSNIATKLCDAAQVEKGDTILEIGPGHGAITEKLLQRGATVIAIEKDNQLAAILKKRLGHQLQVITGDALTFPIDTLQGPIKVVSNLPFNITTPFLLKYVPSFPILSSLSIVIQKEVAQKLCQQNDKAEKGFLSLYLQAYSSIDYCFSVHPSCFFPKPSVESAALQLQLHPFSFPFDSKKFFEFMLLVFSQKRKMLRSSLKGKYQVTQFESATKNGSLFLERRPEALSLKEFAFLFQELRQYKSS